MNDELTATTDRFRLVVPLEYASSLPTGAAKQAVETLGRRIANDRYRPEDTMPTEAELAQSLGVSRATVRDAVKVLTGKGMVRTARRYGTRVRPVEEWNLLDGDVVGWHAPEHPRIKRMFWETTELRVNLEPAAAALAAERATDEQVAAILNAAHAIAPETSDVQSLFTADCTFHVTVLDATCNNVMRQLRQIVLTMLRISYELGVIAVEFADVDRAGHIAVAKAIEARAPDRARRAMAEMLNRNTQTARHMVEMR